MWVLAAACSVADSAESVGLPDGCRDSTSSLERVLQSGTLRAGYVVYPPTVVKDSRTGELDGFFIDAIRFIAERMDVDVEFHEAEWRTVLADLQRGKFDVSVAATFRTIPRALGVAFTRPIIFVGDGAVVRRDDRRFERLEDFDTPGVVVAVVEGTSSHDLVRRQFPRATHKVLSTSDMQRPLEEVLAGRADVGISDAPSTRRFAETHPQVVDLFGDEPFEVTAVGWAACQGDFRWLRFLDTALDYVESTGRMRKWQARYE